MIWAEFVPATGTNSAQIVCKSGGMRLVTGVVQHYAWGDRSFIPRLLGVPGNDRPWAELWLGTHRGGPAKLEGDVSLRSVSGELPYLLKVLAAAEPLSLQTHPSRQQAERGFAREERDGPEVDASTRIYRDPYPKPEMLCALTSFDALCGFRPVAESIDLLRRIAVDDLADHLERHGLESTVRDLYTGKLETAATIAVASARAAEHASSRETQLVADLAGRYPHDPSLAVTLLLNRVTLEPGEAIFLAPGNLHAYLSGAGIEIMGASDNVVRGGLSPKHIDVSELLDVVGYDPLLNPVTVAVESEPGRWRYDTPDTPFRLWRYEVDGTLEHRSVGRELLICTTGSTDCLEAGEAAYLADHERLTLHGHATVFRVEER